MAGEMFTENGGQILTGKWQMFGGKEEEEDS
jgi:hypothetical protein